ncbi:glycoside hydrolase family 18 protein [bacterium]|nr:glycoside hydrolase family 18 protein [bacterium]MBT6777763.1 glycoside hydrolase family 18 protein [bacterium]
MKKYIVIAVLGFMFFSCGSSLKQKTDSADSNGQSLTSFDIEPPSVLIATESTYQTNPIDPSSVMMGYLIEGYKPTTDQFKKMTHVSISFLRAANSGGDIKMTNGWENIDEVIAAAHSNNVKVLISFGGGEFKVTSELMGVKENRQNLIRNIIDFMIKHNLDGFDCDWEPSWINDKAEMEAINNAITNYYIVFIKEFREALDIEFGKGNKLFTAAILNANNIWYSDEKQIAHFPQNGWWNYLDWVSLMNYDNDVGEKHATFESVFGVNGSVAYWTTFGIPHKKIVTGIPFYARAGWGSEWLFYKQVIEMNPTISDTLNFIIHNKNDSGDKVYGFNGTKVAVQKVAKGKNLNLAGIMFWQLAGDVPSFHKKSLLKAMHEEFIK